MPNQSDIDGQQTLLQTYRDTLGIYLKQLAILGEAYAPPGVFHGISEARQQIAHIKQNLRGWGIAVPDHPHDADPRDQRSTTPKEQVTALLDELAIAHHAYQSQIGLRTQLVMSICQRLGRTLQEEYELFFLRYFDQMNPEERFLHQRSRALTHTIAAANQKALELMHHLHLDAAVPLAPRLRSHLNIWLNKYEHVFHQTAHMALVYVGVEEKARFPVGVEAQLSMYRDTLP